MKGWVAHVTTAARYIIGIGVVVYLAKAGGLQWSALGRLASAWWLTGLAFGFLLVSAIFTSWRLCVLMAPRGLELPLSASVRLTLIGLFFNTCLPGAGGGDVIRIYYGARGHEGRRAEIVAVMVLDRLAGMFSMILLPVAAAFLFWPQVSSSPILRALIGAGFGVAIGMLVAIAVAWSPLSRIDGLVHRTLKRIPAGPVAWSLLETVASFRNHRTAVAKAVGISVIAQGCAMTCALLLARVITGDGFDPAMFMLIPMGFMANMVPLTPGGLGVGEAAFDALFGLLNLEGGAETMLAWRLMMVAVAMIGLAAYLSGRRDFVRAARLAEGEPAG